MGDSFQNISLRSCKTFKKLSLKWLSALQLAAAIYQLLCAIVLSLLSPIMNNSQGFNMSCFPLLFWIWWTFRSEDILSWDILFWDKSSWHIWFQAEQEEFCRVNHFCGWKVRTNPSLMCTCVINVQKGQNMVFCFLFTVRSQPVTFCQRGRAKI